MCQMFIGRQMTENHSNVKSMKNKSNNKTSEYHSGFGLSQREQTLQITSSLNGWDYTQNNHWSIRIYLNTFCTEFRWNNHTSIIVLFSLLLSSFVELFTHNLQYCFTTKEVPMYLSTFSSALWLCALCPEQTNLAEHVVGVPSVIGGGGRRCVHTGCNQTWSQRILCTGSGIAYLHCVCEYGAVTHRYTSLLLIVLFKTIHPHLQWHTQISYWYLLLIIVTNMSSLISWYRECNCNNRYVIFMMTSWQGTFAALLALFEEIHRSQVDSSDKGPGPCITNVFTTRRKSFSQWHRSFQRKLRSHWLKFLRHVAITLVIQGPVMWRLGGAFLISRNTLLRNIKKWPLTWEAIGLTWRRCNRCNIFSWILMLLWDPHS